MLEFNKSEKELLMEIESVIVDSNVSIFGFMKEKIDNDHNISNVIKSLENKGAIKVEWLNDYPINIELNELSNNIIKDNIDILTINNDKDINYKSLNTSFAFLFIVLGFIVGFISCYIILVLNK